MNDDTRSGPAGWGIVALALLPGLSELLAALVRIINPAVSTVSPIDLVAVVSLILAAAAIGRRRSGRSFPVWGLMAVGAAAVSAGPLVAQLVRWLMFLYMPGLAGWRRELSLTDILANVSYGLSFALVFSAGSYGFVRYWRSNRPTALMWGVIALTLAVSLFSGGAFRAIAALYLLVAAGLGLVFTRAHGQRAALVLFGVLLAWMGVMDIDYALAIYYDQLWVIELYGILWRVLVFVAAPLWLLRAPLTRRVVWGVVLPVAAALAMETMFATLVKPYLLPHTWQEWLAVVPVAILNPIALAFAAALLLYRQDYESGRPGTEAIKAPQPSESPPALARP